MISNILDNDAIQGSKFVRGVQVPTLKKEICNINTLSVEVGTTGYKGGDTGHGGRTYLCIKDEDCTDIKAHISSVEGRLSVEMKLGGDAELNTLIDALEFASTTLRKMSGRKDPTRKELQQDAFRLYIIDLIKLFRKTRRLSGMSEVQKKHKVAAITKAQFYELRLDEAARDEDMWLSPEYCNKIYEYVLDRSGQTAAPKYMKGQ